MLFYNRFFYLRYRSKISTIQRSLIIVHPILPDEFLPFRICYQNCRALYVECIHACIRLLQHKRGGPCSSLIIIHACKCAYRSPLSPSVEHAHFSGVIFWNSIKLRFRRWSLCSRICVQCPLRSYSNIEVN